MMLARGLTTTIVVGIVLHAGGIQPPEGLEMSLIETGDTVRSRGFDYLYTVTEVKEMSVGGHVAHIAWIEAKNGGRSGYAPLGELELISKS